MKCCKDARQSLPVLSAIYRIGFALALSASCVAGELRISGVDETLENNVRLLVGPVPAENRPRAYRRFLDQLENQAANAMAALGYYAADISITMPSGNHSDSDQIIQLDIIPNQPVIIRSRQILIEGPASQDQQFQSELEAIDLPPGEIFRSDNYESVKNRLIVIAQDLGYFSFRFTRNNVIVSRENRTADVVLIAQSGERYAFGPVRIVNAQLSNTFIRRWISFKSGDPYESGLIGETTQNLQSSGYFSSVRVKPIIDPRYDRIVPVSIELKPKENNEVSVGLGYATDTEFRTKLNWAKPRLNSNGHSAAFGLGVSRQTQNASVSYRIPRDTDPLFHFVSFNYGLKNDTSGNTDSFLSTLNLQYVKRIRQGWTRTVFLRYEREDFELEDQKDRTDLILPGFSFNRSRSFGDPFPVRGQSLNLEFYGGSKRALSTIDLTKIQARARYLLSPLDRHTFIGSLQYGAIYSSDDDRVPVSQRFFAGGDRSVRGFGFRDLSPRSESEEAVGGRFLEVLSLEYNYRVTDRWSLAMFSDGGRAFDERDASYSVGAGLGIRWQSPVGPFRLDVATPISDNDTGNVRVHLSLGPEF